jgi:phosphorylated CTD-interacting factor 1
MTTNATHRLSEKGISSVLLQPPNRKNDPPTSIIAAGSRGSSNRKTSKKQRNKPILAAGRKLHQLPESIETTGVGAAMAALPNRILGQGKRKVWAGVERCVQARRELAFHPASIDTDGSTSASTCTAGRRSVTKESFRTTTSATSRRRQRCPWQPNLEALRAAWIFKLRKRFRDYCGSKAPPALAFERWFQTNEMLFTNNSIISDPSLIPTITKQRLYTTTKTKPATINWESILKGPSAPAAIAFKADLERATIDCHDAERIICSLYENVAAAARDMAAQQAAAQRQEQEKSNDNAPTTATGGGVKLVRHKHTYDLFLPKNQKHILKLNHEHYDKLASLWNLTHDLSPGKDDDRDEFHSDLYCLLARYYSIQGPGFQAACPEAVFDTLQSGLHVQHECFASPLNCYYGSFCSAFFEVDEPFGSSGSFWDFSPTQGGSFQANPPFVHHVMVRMVSKIESLLMNDDTVPLSFVVIVPVWLEESSYQAMAASKFKTHHFIIAKADHGFCDGAQHQRRDRYRVSPYDTAVFILQNPAGQAKFVPPPTFEADLRRAFATGVPTEAAILRRKRDGRGETDEDGGGGVYKGRKRNKTGDGVEQRRRQERATAKPAKKMKQTPTKM